jgi:hypothetical protein
MDTRHAELIEMFKDFLGPDSIGRPEFVRVEELQVAMCAKHKDLWLELEFGQLDDESYVDAVNSLISSTFAEIESVLGKEDFEKLFGVPRDKISGFIDKEIFLASRKKVS